ncbi:UPF0175 family protein [Candidatus Poribacteria bacterium]|nr:UPF0175 family protein [Candidatus Poribacteria bacterium]
MAEKQITEAAVLALFGEDKATVSRGAQLLDIPIQDFMDLLNANDIPLDDETPEEMEQELQSFHKLIKKYE